MIEKFPNQDNYAWLIYGEERICAKMEAGGLWVAEFKDGDVNVKAKNVSLEKLHDFIAQALDILGDAKVASSDTWFDRLSTSFGESLRYELANGWTYLFALISLIGVMMFMPLHSAFEMTTVFLLLVLIFKGNKIGS